MYDEQLSEYSSPTMKNFVLLLLLNLTLVFTDQASTNCNLKAIFQTPRKRNYDDFEILERSNFQSDEQLDNSERIRLQPTLPSSLSNANILLKLGDYKNAIRRNNNNINTRITLAGPNHNNYYHPSCLYPSEIPNVHPCHYAYSVPRTPQYYIFSGPNYVPRYQILPQNVPIYTGHYPNPNEIIFGDTSIQHIPPPHPKKCSSPSNGLNTMTVIPKILIDTVTTKPEVLEIFETQNPEKQTECGCRRKDNKLEIGENQQTDDSEIKVIFADPDPSSNTRNPVRQTCPGKHSDNSENLQIIKTLVEENIQDADQNAEEIKRDFSCKCNKGNSRDTLPEDNLEIIKLDLTPMTENVVRNLQSKPCEIHNIDHPRVLHPINLSGNIENVEIVGAGNVNLSLSNNSPQGIRNCKNSKDLELVKLLQKSLVPLFNLKTKEEPKFLVSYPVIHNTNGGQPSAIVIQTKPPRSSPCKECNCKKRKPKADIDDLNVMNEPVQEAAKPSDSNYIKQSENYQISSMNTEYSPSVDASPTISGYQISSGSEYYQDPDRNIFYTKPTEIISIPPQISPAPANLISQQLPLLQPAQYSPEFTGLNAIQPSLPTLDSSNSHNFLRCIYPSSGVFPVDFPRSYSNPYVSDVITVPRIVKCPQCSRDYDVPSLTAQQTSVWNPKPLPPRCPHCAKYTGELNQLG